MANESESGEEAEYSNLGSADKSQHGGEAPERAPQDETMKTAEATEQTIPMSLKLPSSKQEIPEETKTTSTGSGELLQS